MTGLFRISEIEYYNFLKWISYVLLALTAFLQITLTKHF